MMGKETQGSEVHCRTLLDQLNQDAWYRSGEDYAAWARETFASDKALIERLGLSAKT